MTEELSGQIRHILTSIGGVLVGMGFVSQSWVEPAVGVGMALIGFAWSYVSKKKPADEAPKA